MTTSKVEGKGPLNILEIVCIPPKITDNSPYPLKSLKIVYPTPYFFMFFYIFPLWNKNSFDLWMGAVNIKTLKKNIHHSLVLIIQIWIFSFEKYDTLLSALSIEISVAVAWIIFCV